MYAQFRKYSEADAKGGPFEKTVFYGTMHNCMVPIFPAFKELEYSDKESIEKIIQQFPPYSDFDFTSMYSWNTQGAICFSILNDNLVVQFADYMTGEPFFSFIGTNNANETAREVLRYATMQGMVARLRLVPHEVAQALDISEFKIYEDRDSFDYVYDTVEHSTFSGGGYSQRRNEVNAILKSHPNIEARAIDLKDLDSQERMISLYSKWATKKLADQKGFEHNEEMSFLRLMAMINHHEHGLHGIGVYRGSELLAFCIYEKRGNYAVGHTAKSDIAIKGTNAFLMRSVAAKLVSEGTAHFNYEQDLGLANLRVSKERYRPSFFLKKYTVEIA